MRGYLRDALGVRDRIDEVDDTRREDVLLGSVPVSGCFRRANAIYILYFNWQRGEFRCVDFQEARSPRFGGWLSEIEGYFKFKYI